MDFGQETPGCVQLAIDECGVENQFRPLVGDLRFPVFYLAVHRLEVPLDPVNTHCKRINEIEALAVLSQYRSEHAWDNASNSECGDVQTSPKPTSGPE
jgi:hypothetical protein